MAANPAMCANGLMCLNMIGQYMRLQGINGPGKTQNAAVIDETAYKCTN